MKAKKLARRLRNWPVEKSSREKRLAGREEKRLKCWPVREREVIDYTRKNHSTILEWDVLCAFDARRLRQLYQGWPEVTSMIELIDDGTMGTVLRCSECGEEMRYNYDPCETEEHARELELEGMTEDGIADQLLDDFVEWAIEDATENHECRADEPDEDAITTTDHERFYQYGKPVFWLNTYGPEVVLYVGSETLGHAYNSMESAIRAYMDRVKFWPDVWFISDHGNAHRIEL